jgi:hypothetical protein
MRPIDSWLRLNEYAAYSLGGANRVVTIGGVPDCLRDVGCVGPKMTLKEAPPEEQSACARDDAFCIAEESATLVLVKSS